MEARQAAGGGGAATGNNALGASVGASVTDGLGRLVVVAPPPPLPAAKAKACARALGRLHGALWDLSPPSAYGAERERRPSAADLTPPPLYASFLFDEPDGEATRQAFAQKSAPGGASLLQTFLQRYATHASFAPLLQARSNPNPNPNPDSNQARRGGCTTARAARARRRAAPPPRVSSSTRASRPSRSTSTHRASCS